MATRYSARRRMQLTRREPHREGFEFQGRWITPDEAHRTCKALMDHFDRLPREKRDYVNEKGEW